VDLEKELEHFRLALNSKKIKILELPQMSQSSWIIEMENIWHFQRREKPNASAENKEGENGNEDADKSGLQKAYLDYKSVQLYFDTAIKWMQSENDAAIFKYAIKTIGSQELSDNARKYTIKTMLHFAYIYPYLIRVLDEYVFEKLMTGSERADEVKKFTDSIFDKMVNVNCYEGVAYCLYFSLK